MKILRLLIGIRLRSMLGAISRGKKDKAGRPKKTGAGAILLSVFLLGFLFVFFSFVAGMMLLMVATGVLFTEGADPGFFYAISAAATMLLCLFGSVAITKNELYGAKDNDLLLSMPIPPSTVLISRMVYLLLCNLYFGGIVALPALLIHLAFFGANVMGGVLFLLALLLQPLVSLALASILGWLLSLILPRLRFKKLLALIGMVLGILLYMWFCFGLGDVLTYIEENIFTIVTAVTPYLGPYNWLGSAAFGHEILPTVLFFGANLAVLALAYLFLSRTYIATLTAKRGEAKRAYREKRVRGASAMGALVRREFLQFFSYPMYIFNEALGLFFTPVVGLLALLKGGELIREIISDPELAGFGDMLLPLLPAEMAAALCMLGAMCIISAPSLSVEGKHLWNLKILPVRAGDILCAKAYMHIIATLPFFVPTSLMLVIALAGVMPLGFFDVLAIFLLPFAFNCFVAFLGITLNFAFPRFDYPTVAAAVKSGVSVLITMFAAMILALVIGGIAFLGMGFASLLLCLVALVLLGICFVLRAYLNGKIADARFVKLG